MVNILEYIPDLVYFVFKCAEGIISTTVRLSIYNNAQLELQPSEPLYNDTATNDQLLDDTQKKAGDTILMYKLITGILPFVFNNFVGTWSDKYGRKRFLLLAFVGNIIFSGILVVAQFILNQFTLLVAVSAIVRGIVGGSVFVTMLLNIQAADATDSQVRFNRMNRLLAMNCFGYTLGNFVVSALISTGEENWRIQMATWIAVGLYILSLLLACCLMKDTYTPNEEEETSEVSCSIICRKILELKDPFVTGLKRRSGFLRLYILSMVALYTFKSFTNGSRDIILLLVKKPPFSEIPTLYSNLMTELNFSTGVICLLVAPAIGKLFSPPRMSYLSFGLVFKLIFFFLLAFANQTWMLYVGMFCHALSVFIMTESKSVIVDFIEPDEKGKIFSLISLLGNIANFIGPIFFTMFYTRVLNVHPGTVFFIVIGCFCLFIPVIIKIFVYFKKDDVEYTEIEQ